DYEYATSCLAVVGSVEVFGTFLAATEDSSVRRTGLDVLRSVRVVADEPATIPVVLTPPPGTWDLRFELPHDFAVGERQVSEDGTGAMLEAGTADGWQLTAF